jgi:hypothetical protein
MNPHALGAQAIQVQDQTEEYLYDEDKLPNDQRAKVAPVHRLLAETAKQSPDTQCGEKENRCVRESLMQGINQLHDMLLREDMGRRRRAAGLNVSVN